MFYQYHKNQLTKTSGLFGVQFYTQVDLNLVISKFKHSSFRVQIAAIMFYQYRQKWRRVWLRFVHKVKFSIQVAFLTRVSKKLVKPNQFAMSLQSSERRGTQSLFASRCVESLANLPQFIIGDTSVWTIKYVM
ncbi:Hypothetical_protein [Hexamita inflata]|uniref:Hypothetical_protein n=1 Tax=Hexamita inflata TaxID=28002 RepID=A0AA86PP86_9EUKA|nr:Hypothetical protein HINF_LOCUS26665 [Hexamita inflata]